METRNNELRHWASEINSRIHHKQINELYIIRTIHWLSMAFGYESCIPVGSCEDGSKVNVPGDIGDVDVLLISGKLSFEEEELEYHPDFPAFLSIPCLDAVVENEMLMDVELIDDIYFPVRILKETHKNLFHVIKAMVRLKSSPCVNEDGSSITYAKESAVGWEIRVLDGISSANIKSLKSKPKIVKRIQSFENLVDRLLGIIFSALTGELNEPVLDLTDEATVTTDQVRISKTLGEVGNSIKQKFVSIFKDKFEIVKGDQSSEQTQHSTTNHDNNVAEDDLSVFDHQSSAVLNEKLRINPEFRSGISAHISSITSIDYVPALLINGWPKPAKEWITRKRKWPSNSVVGEIVETGCQIVVKHLPFMTIRENDRYFRLSFALSELILAENMCSNQRLVWKSLKALQKLRLVSKPKVLSSYHWKNVMFWISENKSEHFWNDCNLLTALTEALDFMIECLGKQFLPQYFVRSMNLIADCNPDAIDHCKETIIVIRENPEEELKIFIKYPPRLDDCYLTPDEIEEIKEVDVNVHFKNCQEDLLNIFTEFMKLITNKENSMERKCNFIDGIYGVFSEMESMLLQKHAVTDEDDVSGQLSIEFKSQMLVTLHEAVEIIDPRLTLDEKLDSKHLKNVKDCFSRLASLLANDVEELCDSLSKR